MSKRNHKKCNIEKDILKYSLAAGAALLGTAGVNAAIHHTDLGSGVVLNNDGETFDIDFDGGGAEFKIFFLTSTAQVNIEAETANASWRGYSTSASALINGDNVDSGAQWGQKTQGNGGNMAFYWSSSTFLGGNFLGTSDKYLGVRFDIGGDTHYGWIQVQVPANSSSATITGYAYEDTSDGQITAGAIPEPGSLALLAIGAAGLVAWRKNR